MTRGLAEHVRSFGRRLGIAGRPSAGRLARDAQRYWSGSSTDACRRDLSHWAGEGRWADQDRWRRIGRTHLAMFHALCDLAGAAPPRGRMLEWGPGGGANAVCFAEVFETFIGVDISQANLDECGRQLEAMGYGGFEPVHIEAAAPESVLDRVGEPIDLFLCTAVYQHMPGKEYGRRVTRCAAALLAPGGLALIQTRYPGDDPATGSKCDDYERNVLQFTAYRVEEFWALARECGLEPLAVRLVEQDRYAYYFLRKPPEDGDE
ncbi:MAG: class I SAM-dependent methyltransferase [Planctomycetes bacterium]|nr:class I SAM-dependent methyltransferase [Planctomycetota bacterium]